MNTKAVVAVCFIGGFGVGVGAYILWKRKHGEDWLPSFVREKVENFCSPEEAYDGYSENENVENDDEIKINDPKMYSNPVVTEKPSYEDGKPPIGMMAAKVNSEKYTKAFKNYSQDELRAAIKQAEVLEVDIPEEVARGVEDEIKVVNEIEADVAEMPWDEGLEPIDLEEFLNGEPFFDKINVMYFPDEDILAAGEKLDKVEAEDSIGLKGLALMQTFHKQNPDDTSACVMVRNRQEGIDYQCYSAPDGLTYEEAMLDAHSMIDDV